MSSAMTVGKNLVGSGKWAVGSKFCPNPLPTADCQLPAQSGVILIALLWVLTALCLIALTFSKESFSEMASARNARSLENSYFIARAGIDATIYQILQKRYAPSMQQNLRDEPDAVDLGMVKGTFGGGEYVVEIQDESGKISLNLLFDPNNQMAQLWRNLMEYIGIPKLDADIITDSILDWKDPDTQPRPNGAEDDYYQTLNPPYRARNQNRIEHIEELLLIRGVTPEYFYGYPERNADGGVFYKYGLSRYFTVYSNISQVNVNYAPLPVLMSVPGMSQAAAKAIYDHRHIKPFKSLQEISQLGLSLDAGSQNALGIAKSETYTLTVSAHTGNSKARCIIRAVIAFNLLGLNQQYRILDWNENVPDYEGMTQ